MAIYSCNLKSIGRTTHAPGTAGAHIRYISRPEAHPVMIAEHMPRDPMEARNWMDRAERASRKNARVLDKIRIALPRELDEAQRVALIKDYMNALTGGRPVPWYAAIHQAGSDAHNPHVHIAVHDRELKTGKRSLRLSDSSRDRIKAGLPGPKAVDWVREQWETVCNRALKRGGHEARVDRRTLEAQGIDRTAPIHVGPRASHIYGAVKRPASRRRVNGAGRVIDYPAIDRGKTRLEFNAQVIDLNLERAARSSNPVTAAWAAFEKDQLGRDRTLEERLAAERQQRTAERRNTANRYNARAESIRAEARLKRREALRKVQKRFAAVREAVQERQRRERDSLKARQSRLYVRLMTALDVTGITRRRQEAARRMLSAEHREERHSVSKRYRAARQEAVDAIRERTSKQLGQVRAQRARDLAVLRDQQRGAARQADRLRQAREADREQMREATERKITAWQQGKKEIASTGRQEAAGSSKQDSLTRAFRKAKEQREAHPRTLDGGRSRTR